MSEHDMKPLPGPWTPHLDRELCAHTILGPGPDFEEIATVWTQIRPGNVSLIAAAPDMLAELKSLAAVLEHYRQTKCLVTDYGVRLKTARAVVAKAEGNIP